MKLQRITVTGADGVKGRTFREELAGAGVDVWTGPNGAGKSTRLIAVLAALRGLAETPTDPVREYLGPTLPLATVDLDFEGAPRLTRTLSAKRQSAAAKAADGAADLLVGPHLVRWDLADLSAAADSERAKVLQRVCDLAAGASLEAVLAQLGDGELVLELRRAVRETAPAPAAWLKAAMSWCSEQFTRANADQKAATVAPLGDPEPLFGTLEEAEAALRQLRDTAASAARAETRAQEAARLRAGLGAQPPEPGAAPDTNAARKAVEESRELFRLQRAEVERLRGLATRPAVVCRHCGQPDPLGESEPVTPQQVAEAEARLAETERLGRVRKAVLERQLAEAEKVARDRAALDGWLQTRRRLDELEVPHDAVLAPSPAALAQAQARRDAHLEARAREADLQRALARRDAAVARFEGIKALRQRVQEVAARVTADGFPLIAGAANLVLERAGIPLRVEIRSGSDFGAVQGEVYAPWWALSDGERAVVGAALSVAFAQTGGARWRAVFLDGLEVVDPDRRARLLGALAQLVQLGELDNVLATQWADSPIQIPGAEVHPC